ncbi:arylsulfatase [Parapedobacter sp. 2B3]|uniref:sulfatase family protein n=1 Tax=Parapedobacter sp. 2B3 TaxID=3342381 RepID=UPI0035B5DD66
MKRILYGFFLIGFATGCQVNGGAQQEATATHPNIIVINMDDLGYGDIGAYGATALQTPNIDRLAEGGVRFTNGYATSATCTPSRFALLTGVYPWRNENARILPGTAPLLIDTAQLTLPKMLKEAGYHTGVVGKWHLGLGAGNANWNERITPGPNEVGFDYSFIMAATQDRVPTVYIEDGSTVGLDPKDPIFVSYETNFEGEPTGLDHPELLKLKWHHGHNNSIVNGIPRIGFMKGGTAAHWKDEEMADTFLAKARAYITEHKEKPFFLYYAMQQPHVPRTPHPRFAGTTGLGSRGDAIAEADWCVGQLLELLDDENLLEHTLIVFTSDNGPVVNDGYQDEAVEKLGNHTPSGPFRGGKYSLYEGGVRIPFIVYWKGTVSPKVSDALVCQVDLLASFGKLTGSTVSTGDSEDYMDVLLGRSNAGRTSLILEASARTALRHGNWVMIPPYDGPAINKQVNIELGNNTEYQLFDIKSDPGQQRNVAKQQQDTLKKLVTEFQRIRGTDQGRHVKPLVLQ